MSGRAQTLTDLVRQHAAARPGAPALIDGATGETVTYRELLEPAVADAQPRLAFFLMRESLRHVRTYVDELERRGTVALIDPAMAADRFDGLVDRYRPDVVLGTPEDLEAAGLAVTSRGDQITLARHERDSGAVEHLHEDLQLLLSTSGSTGSPKFVRLSAQSVCANAVAIAESLHLEETERAITCLPLHYTYGLSIVHSHLAAGAAIVCTPPSLLAGEFWDRFRRHEATSLAGVPFSYRIYDRLQLLEDPPPSLRSMTQAGGKFDAASVQRWAARLGEQGRRFYVMYGQTEATARMSVLPPELAVAHPATVGHPVPGGHFEIDEDSEVVYHGPNVMMGYATCREDLAVGDELRGVLRTGDLGELTEEGLLRITGRRKRIAKLSGVRVSLDDVEASASGVARLAALAGDDRIRLVVEGEVQDERHFRRAVAAATGVAARDLEVVTVAELPINASGKIDYARLEADL